MTEAKCVGPVGDNLGKPAPFDPFASVSPHQIETLRALIAALLTANQQFNLTSVRDPETAWNKHVVDALQALRTPLFEGPARVIDVGAGAGFPGLTLALARPQLKLTALEATRKKCDFITSTARLLGINCEVVCERAENVGQMAGHRERYDIALARAVGAIGEVCELCFPLVRPGGRVILWRGQAAAQEVTESANAIQKLGGEPQSITILPYSLPGHELNYHLVVIKKLQSTPAGYPRRVGLPRQRPIA